MFCFSHVDSCAVRTNTTTTLVGFSVATGRIVLPEFVNKPQTEATHAIMPHTSTRNHAASALASDTVTAITDGGDAINHRASIDVDAVLTILDGNTVHHQRAFLASDSVSSIVDRGDVSHAQASRLAEYSEVCHVTHNTVLHYPCGGVTSELDTGRADACA